MCSCLQSLCTVKGAGGGDEGGTRMERESQVSLCCVLEVEKKNSLRSCMCPRGWFTGSPGAVMALVVEGEQRAWRMKDGA